MDTIDRTCKTTNSAIRFLVRVYHSKANDDTSYRAQKTINTIINADPTVVIKTMGPYLFKYAEPISKHDDKFFLNDHDFNDDAILEEDPEEALEYISIIKDAYSKCNTDERVVIQTKTSDMLSAYCEYKMAVDNLAGNSV